MKKALLCVLCLLPIIVFGALAADDTTVVEYGDLAKLTQNSPTYIQAAKNLEIEKNRLKDLWSQVASARDINTGYNLTKQAETLEKSIKEQALELETTLEKQIWQSESLFLSQFDLESKLAQQEKTLSDRVAERADAQKKADLGMMSQSALKVLDEQIAAQKKLVNQAKENAANNLKSLAAQLGITGSIKVGALPELDISVALGRDYDKDLEMYLKNAPSLVSQRKKMESITDSHDYASAQLQLDKLTQDAIDALPAQYKALTDKYTSWIEIETTLTEKRSELDTLQKRYNAGAVARKKLTEKQSEIDNALQTQYTSKIELYQALRKYENMLAGW